MSGLERHMHHNPCNNCGNSRCYHRRVKVYPDDGPAGSYHYVFRDCPTGPGVFR